jgi:hypothetical protein
VTDKTAWLMRRMITRTMARRESDLMLLGIVELDEVLRSAKSSSRKSSSERIAALKSSKPTSAFGLLASEEAIHVLFPRYRAPPRPYLYAV